MCEANSCLANICTHIHKHTSANAQAQTHELGDVPRAGGYIHRYSVFVWFHSRFCWGSVLSDAPWRACRRLWWGGFFVGGLFFWCVGGLVVLCGSVLGLRATRVARRQLLVGGNAERTGCSFPPLFTLACWSP